MASKFICRTNKFGYCWYGEKCKNKHVNELCEKRNCEIFNCEKRHPKIIYIKETMHTVNSRNTANLVMKNQKI